MPTKTKSSQNSTKSITSGISARKHVTSVYSIISRMLEYEDAARKNNINFNSCRFKMLTASERDFLRAELVADYIRLCAANTGNTPGFYDSALYSFCAKICELELPTNEVLGTYLAAQEVAEEEHLEDQIPNMNEIVKKTMFSVLQTTLEMFANRTDSAIAKSTTAENI